MKRKCFNTLARFCLTCYWLGFAKQPVQEHLHFLWHGLAVPSRVKTRKTMDVSAKAVVPVVCLLMHFEVYLVFEPLHYTARGLLEGH